MKTAPAEGNEKQVARAAYQLMLWEAGDDYTIVPIVPIVPRVDKA